MLYLWTFKGQKNKVAGNEKGKKPIYIGFHIPKNIAIFLKHFDGAKNLSETFYF